MPNGFGRGVGFGFRGGMGFGFRGSSPPWPYVGIGRGGLPRCGYFLDSAATALAQWPYPSPGFGNAPFAPQPTPEQELDFLKNQAQAMKGQLEEIEARIQQLEAETEGD